MKRERVDELALSGRSEFGYSNEGKAAVNNKGIPKGESSQLERGDERGRSMKTNGTIITKYPKHFY